LLKEKQKDQWVEDKQTGLRMTRSWW